MRIIKKRLAAIQLYYFTGQKSTLGVKMLSENILMSYPD